ncbi:hypothetical protein LH612_36540, partial [Klebsiella pneumoniae]|nr:hypothetical protein [Klebsiella pneumoniae]
MSTFLADGRTELITVTDRATRSPYPWASSQSNVAEALRAPSMELDEMMTSESAMSSTPFIAECIKP